MIALVYLAILVAFGDALASRWFTFVSLPHRLATGFLVGLLTGTWISYLTALLASRTVGDPMAVGALASAIVMLLAAIWLWRHEPAVPGTRPSALRSIRSEWVVVLAVAAAVATMMIWTYHYDQGTLWIAGDLWSDFGPTSAISQSFALGHNFPTEYPHYAGEPIRYHFLYYFQVGNLTHLGLDPATANNVLSIASMVAMLVVVAALGERLFRSRLVGWIGVALFFFTGTLSFIPYLGSFPTVLDGITHLPDLDHFLSSGFPFRGEEWGVWTQDVYLNQRHLPSAIGILLIIVLFLIDRLPPEADDADPGWRGFGRRLATMLASTRRRIVATATHPAATVAATLRDPYLPGYILCGILAGLLPLYNGAMFIAAAAVLGVLFVIFPNRLQMVVLGIAAAIPAIPQLLFLRPGTMAGAQTYPTLYWGYTVDDPTPIRVATYLAFIFGPKLILSAVGLVLGSWRQARVFLAFAALAAVAFLIQLSVEVLANHKFIHTWLIVANLFVAYALVRLWRLRSALGPPSRLIAAGLAAIIVAGGVVDLFPIKNERMYQAGVDGDPLYEWVRTSTRPSDVFLTDFYVVHGILLAGRKVYLGWPYYSWSAGYAVSEREDWYRNVFATRSAQDLARMLQAAGIAYVAFDDGLRDRGFAPRLNEELFQANFDLAFGDPDNHYGHLAIYRVPTDPAASAGLPAAPVEDMYAGGAGSAPGQFQSPRGIALDRSGSVYVADTANNRIQTFSSDGNLLQTFDGATSGSPGFEAPTGVAVMSNGSIVVAAGDRLVVLDADGVFDRELTTSDIPGARWVDVAVDRGDTIFALDAAGAQVARFAADGSTQTFGGPGANDGELQDPTGIAVRGGTVAVADAGNARVELFDDLGEFQGVLPVVEWQDADVPEADVAIDDDGTVWASSPATNAIVVYRPDGTLAGSLTGDAGTLLDGPSGLALRPGGSLFVVNMVGNRVSLLSSIHP